jgi:D-tyrosyl-tRNA(Tyr) deacylase
VVQRVQRAAVRVQGEEVGATGPGLLVYLGVGPGDDEHIARHLAGRVATLRVFPDDQGRMNRSLLEAGGQALVVSQFTLYAATGRGHRPSFLGAAAPAAALQLCSGFAAELGRLGVAGVAEGRFGAHMEVESVNDGPVTLVVSSGEPPWEADAG